MNENFYYIKYLKYKMKYLKEKEMQIGGLKKGENDDSIFFISSSLDFSFLSNFYMSDFRDDKIIQDGTPIVFNCNEKYFMYRKAETCESSKDVLEYILKQTDANEIRIAGGPPIRGGKIIMSKANAEDWDAVKLRVMKRGLGLKFSQNEALKEKLIATGKKKHNEANKHDRYWGIGFDVEIGMTKSSDEFGENQLGKLLMELREEIKNPDYTVE